MGKLITEIFLPVIRDNPLLAQIMAAKRVLRSDSLTETQVEIIQKIIKDHRVQVENIDKTNNSNHASVAQRRDSGQWIIKFDLAGRKDLNEYVHELGAMAILQNPKLSPRFTQILEALAFGELNRFPLRKRGSARAILTCIIDSFPTMNINFKELGIDLGSLAQTFGRNPTDML